MRKTLFSYVCILSALWAGGILSSCNKDDEISAGVPPVIILDSETGIYEVYAGAEITIAPEYKNAEGATFLWVEEGRVCGNEPAFSAVWDEVGQHYITLTVTTSGGSASEELRVDVAEPKIPYISLPFAGEELLLKVGTDYMLTPQIAHSEDGDTNLTVSWSINGVAYSTGRTLHFQAAEVGDYAVTVKSENRFGTDERRFTIRVLETLPYTVEFPSSSYLNASTKRYTYPERMILLRPVITGLEAKSFAWSVNGEPTDCNTETFAFTPQTAGEYIVKLTVEGLANTVEGLASASVTVACVDATESGRQRNAGAASQACSNKVFEWIPAPGQFIGETQSGGMTGNETTHEAAVQWAEARIGKKQFVSLGGFGGYIIVGFDHSVVNRASGYDFAITANAFLNQTTGEGGSNEPGIVYVSQDTNGNGLPDDEWYELRGSETGKAETIQDYAVTYYRPSAPAMNVQWTDNQGASGSIDYLAAFHRQDYYYPAWITAESYTLRGTMLKARTTQDSAGMWDNSCFDWGYADNMGSDVLPGNDSVGGEGQRNGFKIENAMYGDGVPIDLKYIDFIRVQTGVNSTAGWLGEVSTEVFSFEDLNLAEQ